MGDRAYRDADGYLWFVGRGDDIINSSGYRIGEEPLSFYSPPQQQQPDDRCHFFHMYGNAS